MKVLHISKDNRIGAGLVPMLMHQYIKPLVETSKILLHGEDSTKMEDVIFYYSQEEIYERFKRRMLQHKFKLIPNSKKEYSFQNHSERNTTIDARKIIEKVGFTPDIIYFYWLSGFINTKTIRQLYQLTKAKLIWITTDMAPATGGCHLSYSCFNFEDDCGNCPALDSIWRSKFYAKKTLRFKKKHLDGIPIRILASYGTSYDSMERAPIFQEKEIVPHLLPVPYQATHERLETREKYGLPLNKRILFVGSRNTAEARKGISSVFEVLSILEKVAPEKLQSLHLCIAGKNATESLFNRVSQTCLPFLTLEHELPNVLNACDGFLNLTHFDTGPYMVNLAIANGLPIISYPMGVAKHFIGIHKLGFMASTFDTHELAISLKNFLEMNPTELNEMRNACLQFAKTHLSFNSEVLETYGLAT